jgi:hypothetical protein
MREARGEGAREVFGEEERAIRIETTGNGSPPLLVLSEHRLTPSAQAELKVALAEAASLDKITILPSGMSIYQFIDGRWQPI